MAWTSYPDTMRLIPATGMVVLCHFPEASEESLDLRASEHGTQRRRLEEARRVWIALAAGEPPRPGVLVDAPSLFLKEVVEEQGMMLFEDRVFDHPLIAEGHLCRTSPVLAFEGDRIEWARTVSR